MKKYPAERSPKPRLTIFVGQDLEPYEARFGKSRIHLNAEDREFKASRKGLRGLYFLVAHTILNRINGKEEELPREVEEIIRPLYEINRKNKFEREGVEYVPWLHEIFKGSSPRKQGLLNSKMRNKRTCVEFTDLIEIALVYHSTVPNRGLEQLAAEEVELFRKKWIPARKREFRVEIFGKREGKSFRIDNFGGNGFLRFLDQVRLEISSNFETNFVVFWIDVAKGVLRLAPKLEETLPDFEENLTLYDSGRRHLEIPTKGKFLTVNIDENGTEICVILLRQGKVQSILNEVEDRISKFVSDEFFTVSYSNSEQESWTRRLSKKVSPFEPTVAQLGLGGPVYSDSWKEELAKNFDGFGEEIWIFTIPNY
jgi:hypothetical protein